MWNAEKPYLYKLVFEYEDEIIVQKVGFVTYKIGDNNEFLVNGVEVKLKGVNHHDTHPENGWCMTDEEQLVTPFKLSTMRAPTSNERNICKKWYWYNTWEAENFDRLFNKIYDCKFKDGVITVSGSISGVSRSPYFKYTLEYCVCDDGRIIVTLDEKIKENCVWLPHLGFEFELKDNESGFKYYGMGPMENYCDMHHGSMSGMYESNPDNEYVNYIVPQEHGNHIKTKLLNFENGLYFESIDEMDINVSSYSSEMLMNAKHIHELKKDGNIHVRIDYKNSGIGSASCGPELIEKYRLSEKDIHFGFIIR